MGYRLSVRLARLTMLAAALWEDLDELMDDEQERALAIRCCQAAPILNQLESCLTSLSKFRTTQARGARAHQRQRKMRRKFGLTEPAHRFG